MTLIVKEINRVTYGFSRKAYSSIFKGFIFKEVDDNSTIVYSTALKRGWGIALSMRKCIDYCNKEDERFLTYLMQHTDIKNILSFYHNTKYSFEP